MYICWCCCYLWFLWLFVLCFLFFCFLLWLCGCFVSHSWHLIYTLYNIYVCRCVCIYCIAVFRAIVPQTFLADFIYCCCRNAAYVCHNVGTLLLPSYLFPSTSNTNNTLTTKQRLSLACLTIEFGCHKSAALYTAPAPLHKLRTHKQLKNHIHSECCLFLLLLFTVSVLFFFLFFFFYSYAVDYASLGAQRGATRQALPGDCSRRGVKQSFLLFLFLLFI